MADTTADPYATPDDYFAYFRGSARDTERNANPNLEVQLLTICRMIDEKCSSYYNQGRRFFGSTAASTTWATLIVPRYQRESRRLIIPDCQTLVSVTIDDDRDGSFADETALDSTDWELRPLENASLPEAQPYTELWLTSWGARGSWVPEDRVQLVGTFGWAAVPPAIKQACIELTGILRLDSDRATMQTTEFDRVLETSREAQAIVHHIQRAYKRP